MKTLFVYSLSPSLAKLELLFLQTDLYLNSMNIIEGELPEQTTWRALLVHTPDQDLGITWLLGLALTQANSGALIVAVLLPDTEPEQIEAARRFLQKLDDVESSVKKILYPIIVQGDDYSHTMSTLSATSQADLLLTQLDSSTWHSLDNVSCTVAAVRGHQYSNVNDPLSAAPSIGRILVPTRGGPNTAHALALLRPLAGKSDITALYVARSDLGPNGEAMGRMTLQQTLQFADVKEKIKTKLIEADSPIEGIVNEAAGYDLVVIGATQESSFDRALFGDIPAAVVRQSKKPVLVTRQPKVRGGGIIRDLVWSLQNVLPTLTIAERAQAYVQIRRSTRPSIDYFIMMALSTIIASLGLQLNSPAVVIGAMLVAPLMAPIVGGGLAIVLGDPRFLRLAIGAVAKGVLLAIGVSFASGLLHIGEPLTSEILARTQPNLLDLGVALFSGVAGAYAMCRKEVSASLPGVAIAAALVPPLASIGISAATGNMAEALGALLLFSTNFVAMSSAAALVFLWMGFRPAPAQKRRRVIQMQSVRITLLFLLVIAILLGATTYRLAQQSALTSQINKLVESGVVEIMDAELMGNPVTSKAEGVLLVAITVRAPHDISQAAAAELQDYIAAGIKQDVALSLVIVPTTRIEMHPWSTPEPALRPP